ncbi:hypothetical protein ACS0TY_028840 [Phlomoides rotata]
MSPINDNNNILAGKDATAVRKPQDPPVKCPRCDSPNTKFCYYNNYSLTQPRHFCKTCRRYWTKGGALRNVPIGGGSRKNKKMKLSDGKSSDVGALKFFQGLTPAMDFQLPRFSNTDHDNVLNHSSSSSFGNLSAPCFNLDSSGVSPPLTGFTFHKGPLGFQEIGSTNIHSNFASSIESLSSINQDLHWKLQQQRLASLFDNNHKENNIGVPFVEKPQPILFQNLENYSKMGSFLGGSSRKDGGNGNLSTELFFNGNAYAATVAPPTPTTSSSNNWSGINQGWNELTQFTSLP